MATSAHEGRPSGDHIRNNTGTNVIKTGQRS